MTRLDFEKDKRLYYSLKELADHFDVNQSLLRFWETEFPTINPRKTDGGTRQYTKEDIEEIAVIFHLVKEKGMTLDGARHALKHSKDNETTKVKLLHQLESIRNELSAIMDELDALENKD